MGSSCIFCILVCFCYFTEDIKHSLLFICLGLNFLAEMNGKDSCMGLVDEDVSTIEQEYGDSSDKLLANLVT